MSTEIPTVADLSLTYASPLEPHLQEVSSAWRPGLLASVVALDDLGQSVPAMLTPMEEERLATMAPRRRRSFLAGRVALKTLAGKWGHVSLDLPARAVETSQNGRPEPLCGPGPGAPAGCSLTHDSQLAVAMAADRPLGVDIEAITPRLQRIASGFASASQRRLAESSAQGPLGALARIFTLKEAVVKATGGELFRTFREVEAVSLGDTESLFLWRGHRLTAHHHVLRVRSGVGWSDQGVEAPGRNAMPRMVGARRANAVAPATDEERSGPGLMGGLNDQGISERALSTHLLTVFVQDG